jgi:phosphate-selective porin OprO and OprP
MRVTTSPVQENRRLFHLGLSVSYRKASSDHTLRFRTHPETSLTMVYFLNTDKIPGVYSHSLIGLEGAWVNGPWSAQSEFMRADVRRSTGSSLGFDGGYLFVSWFVTGESRPYTKRSGTFGRVIPKKNGALELAARYSYLNLTDSSVHGGKERNFTFGVNYYFNPYIRCMTEFVLMKVDSVSGSEHPRALLARLQYNF